MRPGFYGKLPTRGDFVERRLAKSFVQVWDEWLQKGISASQKELGKNWLAAYLTSPIWYFVTAPGLIDEHSYQGVQIPSVDKVGRYFPLCVAVTADESSDPFTTLLDSSAWFEEIESLLLRVLDDPPIPFDEFDKAIEASNEPATDSVSTITGYANTSKLPDDDHFHFSIGEKFDLTRQLVRSTSTMSARWLGAFSIWMTYGSEQVVPSLLITRGLPDAMRFTAMLDGDFEKQQWISFQLPDRAPSPAVLHLNAKSASVSEAGLVREVNEDACRARDEAGIWVVADGLGGHQAGDVASSMVVRVADQVPVGPSLETRTDTLLAALDVVQGNLHEIAAGFDNVDQAASTVAALMVDDSTYACAWAGDSRIYRFRDGRLEQLTRDHIEATNGRELTNFTVTRAVGGPDPLQVDVLYGSVRSGDRFLLCSDGVYQMLDDDHLSELLAGRSADEACEALRDAVLMTEAPDNLTAIVVDVYTELDSEVLA